MACAHDLKLLGRQSRLLERIDPGHPTRVSSMSASGQEHR